MKSLRYVLRQSHFNEIILVNANANGVVVYGIEDKLEVGMGKRERCHHRLSLHMHILRGTRKNKDVQKNIKKKLLCYVYLILKIA